MRIRQGDFEALKAEEAKMALTGQRREKKAADILPPAPATCATFHLQHQLCDKDPRKCMRCRGATTKAKQTAWLGMACYELKKKEWFNVRPPPGVGCT